MIGHPLPARRRLPSLVRLTIGTVTRDGPKRFLEVAPEHGDPRRRGGPAFVEPDLDPLPIGAAPLRPQLAGVLARPFGDQAQAVDADLDAHHLPFQATVPAADGVDLARQRIEPRPPALTDEETQLVVGGADAERPPYQLDLRLAEFADHISTGHVGYSAYDWWQAGSPRAPPPAAIPGASPNPRRTAARAHGRPDSGTHASRGAASPSRPPFVSRDRARLCCAASPSSAARSSASR